MAGDVLRLDARLDTLIDMEARVECVFEDHEAFFEGPVWVPSGTGGHLMFTDIAGDSILTWDEERGVGMLEDSFFDSAPASRIRELDLGIRRVQLKGPDGLALDHQGRIVYCAYGARHVGRIENDGRRTVLAQFHGDRRLNTPNDVVVARDGSVYFTDSSADLADAAASPYGGVPTSAVYRVMEGQIEMLDDDFSAANGLAFSHDGRHLYVNDTRRKLIWRYEFFGHERGLGRRELFADMNADLSPGVPDGMKVDCQGNVYCTGPRGLWILAPDGTHLGIVQTRERLTNLAFGGLSGTTLFMTGPSYIWRLPTKVTGPFRRASLAPWRRS